MGRMTRSGLLIAVLVGSIAGCSTPTAPTESAVTPYVVTRVIDGDTILVDRVGTVRLIGVDTPETVDPRRPVQYFGREAAEFTRRMAFGKSVDLQFEASLRDRYGRTLAYVYLLDGTFLNAEIIRQGYGYAYTRYPFKLLELFRDYEREAREAGRGLWSNATPQG